MKNIKVNFYFRKKNILSTPHVYAGYEQNSPFYSWEIEIGVVFFLWSFEIEISN